MKCTASLLFMKYSEKRFYKLYFDLANKYVLLFYSHKQFNTPEEFSGDDPNDRYGFRNLSKLELQCDDHKCTYTYSKKTHENDNYREGVKYITFKFESKVTYDQFKNEILTPTCIEVLEENVNPKKGRIDLQVLQPKFQQFKQGIKWESFTTPQQDTLLRYVVSKYHLVLPVKVSHLPKDWNLCRIGRGIQGVVYKALWKDPMWTDACSTTLYTENAKNVAIKQIQITREKMANVKAEVNNMSILDNNPHLVKLHAVAGCDYSIRQQEYILPNIGESVMLVTELCFISLRDIQQSKPLPAFAKGSDMRKIMMKRRLEMINHIAKGLKVLHGLNITHCDLNPDNIMEGYDSNFKIIDFGCSKMYPYTYEGGAAGSPSYVAPETFENNTYSPAVDIYSLGIITCELYTNKKPYAGMGYSLSLSNIGSMVRGGARPDTTGIPASLKSLIKKCWQKDPTLRPSAQQIIEITDKWMKDETDAWMEDDSCELFN